MKIMGEEILVCANKRGEGYFFKFCNVNRKRLITHK